MEFRIILAAAALTLCLSTNSVYADGMLFPQESESREIQELNGMWDFRADYSASRNQGFVDSWFKKRLSQTGAVISMPVPSSYNDITTEKKLRDFVGWVWYDRGFFPSASWNQKRVVFRIDSAHYNAIVWVNGVKIMEHKGGHLPFEVVVNDNLQFGEENWVTVAVNNTLSPTTLPPGSIEYKSNASNPLPPAIAIFPPSSQQYPPGYFVQNLQFDFFNYAGIHRRVRLYTTPLTYVDDITIVTDIDGSTGHIHYNVTMGGLAAASNLIQVLDRNGTVVASSDKLEASLSVTNAHLWWPYTMSLHEVAYQYTLKVSTTSTNGVQDVYRQKFGIRTVLTNTHQILINNKPFYCHGVNKHEDSDFRGRGLDLAVTAKDFHLFKWLGANCFRTSHYPYSEELMDEADKMGFAVIDECPGVGIQKKENMGNESLAHHLEVMGELIRRDKNRPSVILWSVANEPASNLAEADFYFKTVVEHTHDLDATRGVTFVSNKEFNDDVVAKYVDVLCINRYYSWYSDPGHPEVIPYQLAFDLTKWNETINRPLIISEYGADTVAGMHTMPAQMFTEEYQVDFMHQYHTVFDEFRSKYLVGELVWNFADFMTSQSTGRVVGNKKGILTRQREPKMAAHLLRERYQAMINESYRELYAWEKTNRHGRHNTNNNETPKGAPSDNRENTVVEMDNGANFAFFVQNQMLDERNFQVPIEGGSPLVGLNGDIVTDRGNRDERDEEQQ